MARNSKDLTNINGAPQDFHSPNGKWQVRVEARNTQEGKNEALQAAVNDDIKYINEPILEHYVTKFNTDRKRALNDLEIVQTLS